jgi:hypothetical protein
VPPARTAGRAIDLPAVRALIDGVLAQGRELLTEPQAKALLAACGVPVVPTRVVTPDAEAAVQAAGEIGYPVVLKILSPQISHKSDVGGVALDLEDAPSLRAAVQAMLARVRALRPDATIEGFTVQALVRRPRALELIVGTQYRPALRAGDPLRPGRHLGGGGGRPRHRPAAAERAAGARPRRAHPRGAAAARLARRAAGRPARRHGRAHRAVAGCRPTSRASWRWTSTRCWPTRRA